MDDQLQRIFVYELDRLCFSAILSAREFNELLGHQQRDAALLFRKLDDIAVYAGRITQILWPTQGDRLRGEALRTLLNIDDNSLLKDKRLRNQIEHFDEKIDEWAKSSAHRNVVSMVIGNRNAVGGNSISSSDILRHWISGEAIYSLRGNEFDMNAIIEEVRKLGNRVDELKRS